MENNQGSIGSSGMDMDGGHAPGTRVKAQSTGTIRTRLYRDGKLAKEDFPPHEISEELRQRHGCIIWLDLCEPTREQLDIIGREFGFHELAIEDAVEEVQRTKIDRYRTHLFMVVHSATLDQVTGELVTHEIATFITHHALITVRKYTAFDIDPVVGRWDGSADLAQYGVSFLLYGLLDYLVDGHFRAVELLDQAIEETEDALFDARREAIDLVQRRSYQLRKSLVVLRRITLPTREVLNTLLRHDLDYVREPMAEYFRDIYDHVIRASEWTESLRDSGHHDGGDQSHRAEQSDEPHYEKGDQLGGHYRRADRHHGLVRPKRPLPWFRQDVRADRHSRPVRGDGYRAVRSVPPQRLALRDLYLLTCGGCGRRGARGWSIEKQVRRGPDVDELQVNTVWIKGNTSVSLLSTKTTLLYSPARERQFHVGVGGNSRTCLRFHQRLPRHR